MVTIFNFVLSAISLGIDNYLTSYEIFNYVIEQNPSKTRYNVSDFLTGIESVREIAYFHYKKWLETHEDLQIGANYLTNLQLYHVADAVTGYIKFSSSSPKDDQVANLKSEYLHVLHKVLNHNAFYDAFKCNVTDDERREFEIYSKKWYELTRNLSKQVT
jgi:hypothetical protein